MATAQVDIGRLQKRIEQLETELEDLRRQLLRRGVLGSEELFMERQSKQESVLRILRAEGFVTEPTVEMLALAQEWEAIPDAEKNQISEKLASLDIDPPLSQRIHDERR